MSAFGFAVLVLAQQAPPVLKAEVPKAEVQQEDQISVAVRVTEVSGESVFLDQGSDAGIEANQRVLLYSRNFGILTGRIRAVTRNSSNCTLEAGSLPVTAGTPGEVMVPRRKPPPSVPSPGPEAPARPEHPPWSAPPDDWNTDSPLLRPAFSRSALDRPMEVVGYSFVHGSYSSNAVGATNQYYFGEGGADLTISNAVSWGGQFKIRAEYLYESAYLPEAQNSHTNEVRVDWFEYVIGNVRQDTFRLAAGRFLHNEFPELDVVDGVELTGRVFEHLRIGGSAGAMTDPTHTVTLTGDYEASLYTRYISDPKEVWTIGAAYQKTMHDGLRDRDLLVGVTEFVPNQTFSARGSVWIDYYTAHEQAKAQGVEVTEAHAYSSYRFTTDHSVGAFFSYDRTPDTLRNQIAPDGQVPTPEEAELLRQNLSLYYGAYSAHRFSQTVLGDTRLSFWQDQSHTTGVSGEMHVGLQDLIVKQAEVGFTAFYTDGIYTKGPGGRLTYNHFMAPVTVMAWYELAYYENTTTKDRALQHTIHLSLDTAASDTWTFSIYLDYRFGYQQDAFTGFISIMKRIK